MQAVSYLNFTQRGYRLACHVAIMVATAYIFSQPLLRAQDINYAGVNLLSPNGIEAKGIDGNNVVGSYDDSSGVGSAFIYNVNSGTYTMFNAPDDANNYARAVSGNNVVGTYQDSSDIFHAFLYNGSTFTTIDPPGTDGIPGMGTGAEADAVSGNNVVGFYIDSSNVTHGFLYNSGVYRTIDPPGSTHTLAVGISGNNVVGTYILGGSYGYGFLYNNGTYTTLQVPGSDDTGATAVSGNNVLGYYYNGSGDNTQYGFLYNGSTYTTIDPPGSVSATPTGFSGNNVVGYYYDSSYVYHGFLYVNGAYTTIDPPGTTSTQVFGAAGNNIVGSYTDTAGVGHGFVYNGGNYTTLTLPDKTSNHPTGIDGAYISGYSSDSSGVYHGFLFGPGFDQEVDPPGTTGTYATAVSGSDAVGYYTDSSGVNHGFLYDVNSNTYNTIDPPGSSGTYANGISGNNIAGDYSDSNGVVHGFFYNGSTYTPLDPSGSTLTHANGVSGNNVVGNYNKSGTAYGFFYNGITFTTLDPPGSSGTYANGVSGNNVVGSYSDGNGVMHGFFYNGSTYTPLDPPGSTGTYANSVSGSNVVGYYMDGSQVTHGFFYNGSTYATLDPPGSSATYAVGVSGSSVVGYYNGFGRSYGFLATDKIPATVTLGSLSATYNGSPQAATATTTPANLNVTFTYNGNSAPPTQAGSYTVVATINDSTYSGSTTGTLVITLPPGTAEVILGNFLAAYDGSPQPVTATTIPPNLNVTLTYNGSSTPPTAAGSYTVVGTVNDPNYTGSTTGTLTITPISQTISTISLSGPIVVGGPSVQLSATADTSPITFSFSSTGSVTEIYDSTPQHNPIAMLGGENDATLTVYEAGTFQLYATAPGAPNYNGTTGPGQAEGVSNSVAVTLSNLNFTYNGAPAVVTGTAYETDGITSLPVVVTYTVNDVATMTAPSAAGSYPVMAAVNDSTGTYSGSTTGTLTIAQEPITVAVNAGGTSASGATPTDPGISLISGTLYGDTLASLGFGDSINLLTSASPAGTYTINVTGPTAADAANYDITTQSATYVISPALTNTYAQWSMLHFTSPELSNMTDPTFTSSGSTPFNDGVPNLLKYLFGINPSTTMTAADRAALPVFGMTSAGDLTLTFGKYSLETGLTINVQTTADLKTWTTLTQGQTLSPTTYTMQPTGSTDPNGDPYMQIQVQPTNSARQFVRLSVTGP